MNYFKLIAATGAVLLAVNAFANQSLTQAKRTLSTYESQLQTIGVKVQTSDTRIKSYQNKIEQATLDLAKAEEELVNARSALIQAQHDKSEDASRKLELAQKKYDITNLGLENRSKRLERLKRKLATVETEKQALEQASTSTQAKIKRQTRAVLALTTQAANAKAAKPAPKQQVASVKKVAPPPAPKPKLAAAPPKKLFREVQPKAESQVKLAKLETPQATKPAAKKAPSADQEKRAYAKQQIALLSQRLKSGKDDAEWRRYKGLELKSEKGSLEEFEFLGSYQYYVEADLQTGPQKIKVGKKHYQTNIPSQGTYVVLYDTTNKNDPKFSLFKKSWAD